MVVRAVMVMFVVAMVVNSAMADEAAVSQLQSVQGTEDADEARRAVRSLASDGAANLLPVLRGFDGAGRIAQNWLRNAFEIIAAAELDSERELPTAALTEFIQETDNDPAARRLAYEWLRKQDPEVEDRLIPQLLTDPEPQFRRDAVARLIAEAKDAEGEAAEELYVKALRGAVDKDQVDVIAQALQTAGDPVDVQLHFGFLPDWKVIGPFDNREEKGFAKSYAPESELNLEAEYEGQLGTVKWQELSTDDDYGIVDIAKQIENYKGSLMYAFTTFHTGAERNVELRLGTPNAWKLWVNGKLVFEREEYHRSTRMDQYRIPVTLVAGENSILLKVCQNEQEQDWAQKYQYQIRVADSSGAAILPERTQQ